MRINLKFLLVAVCLLALCAATSAGAADACYTPSGCGTLVECKESKNAQGELDGPQECINPYNKKLVIKATWKNGLLQGPFACFTDEGVPVVEAVFVDCEPDGEFKVYNAPANAWESQIYSKGKREGLRKRIGNQGHTIVSFYQDDAKLGFDLFVKKDGTLDHLSGCEVHGTIGDEKACEQLYIPGYEQLQRDYFANKQARKAADDNTVVEKKYANGQVMSRYKLVDGRIEGPDESFFKDGKPKRTTTYKNGKREGKELIYFEGGQLQYQREYSGDLLTRELHYYQNGKPKHEWVRSRFERFIDRFDYKLYYDTGGVREQGSRLVAGDLHDIEYSGELDGEIKTYDASGALRRHAWYEHGNPVGTWKLYTKDLEIEERYAGTLKQRDIFDRSSRTLLRHSEFAPDGSTLKDEKLKELTPEQERQIKI
jgi:antitoxin component YwqK of YwqJK toxin-antitoxin module